MLLRMKKKETINEKMIKINDEQKQEKQAKNW